MSPKQESKLVHRSPILVTEPPKFDLDSYIANYEGPTRLDRLATIGTSSKFLGVDALKAGLAEAKRGLNVAVYTQFCEWLATAAPKDPDGRPDTEWIESTSRRVKAESDRLENELRGYKNNLIKESIRMGNEDLGAHYFQTGDLGAAFKAYSRMREYCTTPKHISEMSLKLILVAIAQENWMAVQSNIYKIQALQLKPEDSLKVTPFLSPLSGLAHMSSSSYAQAAHAFLATDPTFATLDAVAHVQPSTQVLTPNDVAVYGGLCALATLSRADLQTQVLDNASFRSFLELEPHLRRAIACFCSAKYTQVLAILDAYRPDYLLDLHLQRHVAPLYASIRRKSIVAYFTPFSRASIASLAETFNAGAAEMEAELTALIRDGALAARIDVPRSELVAAAGAGPQDENRETVLQRSRDMAQRQERALRLRLYRMNMLGAGFEVKGGRGRGKGGGSGGVALGPAGLGPGDVAFDAALEPGLGPGPGEGGSLGTGIGTGSALRSPAGVLR